MRILFASGNGYTPEFSGGVQSSTDHLVRQCRAKGHDARVLAALFGDGLAGFRARVGLKLTGKPAVADQVAGYPVYRAWHPWDAATHVARVFRPDVALVQCHNAVRIGKALAAEGVPLVLYHRNVEFDELGGDLRDMGPALYIANSAFTARAYAERYGIDSTVIPPTIAFEKYATETTRETVTYINLYPEKGLEKAIALASACPDIPFLFVESWKLTSEAFAGLEERLRPLTNVRLHRRTDDMSRIYGQTRILLAPSRWAEAWGRVASEAQCSGIPVIASTQGGLPEAVGPGGVCLDHDAPLDIWVRTLRDLWDDPAAYASLSAAALAHARRPQLESTSQFQTFMSVLEAAAARRGPTSAPQPLAS